MTENQALQVIKKNGWILGPYFKPGFPPNPKVGYQLYANWLTAGDCLNDRHIGAGRTIAAAVRRAMKRLHKPPKRH